MDKLTVASHNTKLSLWAERIKNSRVSGLTVFHFDETETSAEKSADVHTKQL